MMTIGDSYHSYQKLVTEPLESVPEHTCEVLDIKMVCHLIFYNRVRICKYVKDYWIKRTVYNTSLHTYTGEVLQLHVFHTLNFTLMMKFVN